jgi:hypothetical protein
MNFDTIIYREHSTLLFIISLVFSFNIEVAPLDGWMDPFMRCLPMSPTFGHWSLTTLIPSVRCRKGGTVSQKLVSWFDSFISHLNSARCWRLLSTYFKAINSSILPQELCIHSRLGAYTDEFHKCQCKDECMYSSQEMRRKYTCMIQSIQAQQIEGCHVGIYWIHDVTSGNAKMNACI